METAATQKRSRLAWGSVAGWAFATLAIVVILGTAPEASEGTAVDPRGSLPGFLLASLMAGAVLVFFAKRAASDDAPGFEIDPIPWLPLSAVLIVALVLRVIGLGSDLWYDEVFTLVNFVRLPLSTLMATYGTQNNHMLYSLMAKASIAGLGESAFAMRLPAVIFGVAGVAAVFALGRRVSGNRVGLAAAALIAASYHHVWFSQNARGYTIILCLACLGTAWFLDGLRTRRRSLWIVYAISIAAAMYAHLSVVFVFAIHGGVYLAILLSAQRRPTLAEKYPGATELWPLASFVLAGLLIVQAYSSVLPDVVQTFSTTLSDHAAGTGPGVDTWRNPLWTLMAVADSIPGGAPVWIALVLAGAVAAWVWWRLLSRDPATAWILALPIPVTLGTLIAASMHIWPRYFFLYFGFVAVLIIDGIFVLAKAAGETSLLGERRAQQVGWLLVGGLVLGSLATVPVNYAAPKQPYIGAKQLVEAQRKPGEEVMTIGLAAVPYKLYYAPEWTEIKSVDQLREVEEDADGTWLVYSFETHMRAHHPEVLEILAQGYDSIEELPGTLGDGDVHVFHRPRTGR